MHHLSPDALDLFEAHHGVAARSALIELGVSPHLIKRLRRAGILRDVLTGVYHLRGQSLTFAGRCAAVCAAHPEIVIAGPTAGRLWQFRGLRSRLKVHVIAPPASQPMIAPWVESYRTAAIDHERDVVHRPDGISLTTRARTALDLARWLSDDDLLSVIEQVAHDGDVGVDEFIAVAADWISSQRPWLNRYLRLVVSRLDGAAESHPEVLLGRRLQAAGVVGLVRQHRIELPGYGHARFDLAVPRLRWAIEVDVFPTHAETAGKARDGRRDRSASRLGWETTRLGPDRFGAALPATVAELVVTYRTLQSEWAAASPPSKHLSGAPQRRTQR